MGIFGNNDLNTSGKTTGTNTGVTTGQNSFSPYKPAQPLLNKLLADAMGYYKQGKLDPYAGLGGTTNQGLAGLAGGAMSGLSPLRKALSTYSSFAGGGQNVGTGGQQSIFNRALNTNRNVGAGAQNSIYSRAANVPSFSEGNLAGIARGDLLDREDPNFERVLGAASEKAETAARMAAGAKGRYGGDYAQTEVGRTVGDIQAGARVDQYNTERQRQVEANSLMDAMRQGRLGLGLNAANSASSIQTGNQDRDLAELGLGLNAANSRTAIEADNRTRMLQGAAGIPGAFQASLDPFRELLKVGGIKDADRQARADTPGNNLGALAQLLGIAQPYGTQNTTGATTGTQTGTQTGNTQGPDNTLSQGLGLGVGGISLLKMLKDAGGLGGLFSGLF